MEMSKRLAENICGECGCLQEDPTPPVRVEPAGTSSNGTELVSVTFESTAGFMDICRGIIEATQEYTDLDDFINRTLHHQAEDDVARLAKPGKVWKLMGEWGKVAPEEE